jgi:hypothetical protein
LILALVLPARALATSITITQDTTFVVNWLDTSTTPNLEASAQFAVSGFSTSGFTLTVSDIKNLTATTSTAIFSSLGFGLTPDATNATNLVNGQTFIWDTTNFPGFQTVDICATAANNCSAGNAGLSPGQTSADSLSIFFEGDFSNGVTFSPIPARIGGVNMDADSVTVLCPTCQQLPPAVPEPGSLLLLGSGLFAIAMGWRKFAR